MVGCSAGEFVVDSDVTVAGAYGLLAAVLSLVLRSIPFIYIAFYDKHVVPKNHSILLKMHHSFIQIIAPNRRYLN